MELQLDRIEEQHADWIKLLREFYGPFHDNVQEALENLEHAGGTPSPYVCDKCGEPMVYRISKNGFFLACSDRECSETRPVDLQGKPTVREVSEHKCYQCGREMIKRRGRFGEFLGCSGYPECKVIINLDKQGNPLPPKPEPIETHVKCEKCGGTMVLRGGKRGPWLGCSNFPKCRSIKSVKKLEGEEKKQVEALLPALDEAEQKSREVIAKLTGVAPAPHSSAAEAVATDIDCEECGKPMVIRTGRRGRFLACSGYPKCKNTAEVPARLVEEMGIGSPAQPS